MVSYWILNFLDLHNTSCPQSWQHLTCSLVFCWHNKFKIAANGCLVILASYLYTFHSWIPTAEVCLINLVEESRGLLSAFGSTTPCQRNLAWELGQPTFFCFSSYLTDNNVWCHSLLCKSMLILYQTGVHPWKPYQRFSLGLVNPLQRRDLSSMDTSCAKGWVWWTDFSWCQVHWECVHVLL